MSLTAFSLFYIELLNISMYSYRRLKFSVTWEKRKVITVSKPRTEGQENMSCFMWEKNSDFFSDLCSRAWLRVALLVSVAALSSCVHRNSCVHRKKNVWFAIYVITYSRRQHNPIQFNGWKMHLKCLIDLNGIQPMRSQAGPVFLLKNRCPWRGSMLERFMKNFSAWDGPTLEQGKVWGGRGGIGELICTPSLIPLCHCT